MGLIPTWQWSYQLPGDCGGAGVSNLTPVLVSASMENVIVCTSQFRCIPARGCEIKRLTLESVSQTNEPQPSPPSCPPRICFAYKGSGSQSHPRLSCGGGLLVLRSLRFPPKFPDLHQQIWGNLSPPAVKLFVHQCAAVAKEPISRLTGTSVSSPAIVAKTARLILGLNRLNRFLR